MERSLYPNGVIVDTTALRRTELSKAAEILRSRTGWTSRGIHSGGVVSPNGVNPDRVDVTQLSGFTPSGEYLETTQNYTAIMLDSYTSGVDNYVCAVYTEVEDKKQPHETDGATHATRAKPYYRIRVFSETNYNALLPTDANLANNARDRCLLLAIVNANGVGVALTVSDILLPTVYNSLMYATPINLLNTTGVTITGVSPGTARGTGSVGYTYDPIGPTYEFTWTSPTGGIGAAVNPTVDGFYILEDGVGDYIVVQVNISQLPLTSPHTDSVVIENLYYQEIPRQTAEDFLHRNMVGSGIITPKNAHGLSYDDLFGSDASLIQEHRDTMHCNGIWRNSSPNIFFPGILGTVGGDTFTIVSPAAGDLYFINGKKLSSVEQTSIQFSHAVVPPAFAGSHFYEVRLDDSGGLHVLNDANEAKASYPNARAMGGTWIVDMSKNHPAGSYTFSVVVAAPTYTFQWDGGQTVSISTATAPSQVIRLYSSDGVNWVDVWINTAFDANPDARLPGVSTSDTIVVTASPDWDQNMQIYSLTGWYDALNTVYKIGTCPYLAIGSRSVLDKKPWGNLCVENMADCALQELNYHPLDELHNSGVILRRNGNFNEFVFSNPGTPSLDVGVSGGSYYCRGRRLHFDGDSMTLPADLNKDYLMYVDWEENFHILNVTDDFASLYEAMRYVLGSTRFVPDVDEVIHHSDSIDPPERGVLLYLVTVDGSGAVSDYIDMRRNVNGPVDPWSVSTFINHADSVLSAFDNLYSAFSYAELYLTSEPKIGAGITVTVNGGIVLDRAVSQPSGVHVIGSVGVTATPGVSLEYASVSGAWSLSNGCSVRFVRFVNNANSSILFSVGSNCEISNCVYEIGTSNDDFFATFGATCANFRFVGNRIETNSGSFHYGAFFNYNNWFVSENIIEQVGVAGNTALIQIRGSNHFVSSNSVYGYTDAGSSFFTSCIFLAGAISCKIDGNTLVIGGRDGSVSSYGVYYDMASSDVYLGSIVSRNNISREATSTSDVDVGVYFVDGCNGVLITDNIVEDCGVGIMIGGYYKDLSISCNHVLNMKSRGIVVGVTRMTGGILDGLSIDNNIIDTITSGATTGVGWGVDLVGISFMLVSATVSTKLQQVVISNNKVMNISNTAVGGGAFGVKLNLSPGDSHSSENVSVCNNSISDIAGEHLNVAGSETCGIWLFQGGVSTVLSNLKINTNNIITTSNTDAAASVVMGVLVSAIGLFSGSISDNTVNIQGAIVGAKGSGVFVNPTVLSANKFLVSNNIISCPWTGIVMNGQSSTICGNKVYTSSMGVVCPTFNYSAIEDNDIFVYCVYDSVFSVGAGSDYNHCIAVGTGATNLTIRNNHTTLSGGGTPTTIKAGATAVASSSNIWVHNCDWLDLSGNTFKQFYAAISGISNPCHLYCGVDKGDHFKIHNNVIFNHIAGLAESLSYGIFLEYLSASGATEWVSGHLSGNTIMCSMPEAVAWNSGGIQPLEVYIGAIDIIAGPHILMMGNSLHFDYDGGGTPRPRVGINFGATGTVWGGGTNFAQTEGWF